MAKNIYVGVNNIARKTKKAYVGVGGVARKIKKGYVGVAGVARLFFSAETVLSYYGTTTGLSHARHESLGASVGNYALVIGATAYSYHSDVDAYNKSLSRSTPSALTNGTDGGNGSSTSIGNYALIHDTTSVQKDTISTYDISLTKGTKSLSEARCKTAATTVGNYALFGGGRNSTTDPNYRSRVDAFNSSLTRSSATDLSVARQELNAETVGNYAIFGSGAMPNAAWKIFEAYDNSLVKSSAITSTSSYVTSISSKVPSYAIFYSNSGLKDGIAFNSSLTIIDLSSPSVSRYHSGSANTDNYALFAGGRTSSTSGDRFANVDTLNNSLTLTSVTGLSAARNHPCGATVGNYALIAGGETAKSTDTNVVDVYQEV